MSKVYNITPSVLLVVHSRVSSIYYIPPYTSIYHVTVLSDHPLIKRLLKGIYHTRPPQPRYTCIWDTTKVIDYLASLVSDSLDFKMLSLKCVTLLTILSGQRVSTLHKFRLSHMQTTDSMTVFQISDLLKHSRPHNRAQAITYRAYPHDRNLCPVRTVSLYLLRRGALPANDAFFLCHRKPHGPASIDTLARWVKTTLTLAGIDTSVFGAHSCRAASTSQAFRKGVALSEILAAGQWNRQTNFFKFYCRDIVPSGVSDEPLFANAILS